MASFVGTNSNDTFLGFPSHSNSYAGIGLGRDIVVGGDRKDYVSLKYVDTVRDYLDGGAGTDVLDLSSLMLTMTSSPLAIDIRLGENGAPGTITAQWLQSAGGLPQIGTATLAEIRNFEVVYGSRFNDRITGTSAAETMNGGLGNDTLVGLGGADTLRGEAGNDVLRGGTGANVINGGDGNDTVVMDFDRSSDSTMKDMIDGGTGTDTLSFEAPDASLVGVVVSLSTEFAPQIGLPGIVVPEPSIDTGFVTSKFQISASTSRSYGEATITGIENVTGTRGDDILIGDRQGNVLRGGSGDDLLSGETGQDQIFGDSGNDEIESYNDGATDLINGGSGIDTVTYARAGKQVIVTLGENGAEGNTSVLTSNSLGLPSFFQEDRLIDVENIIGSRHNDRLQGNSAANTLSGGDGSDYLFGLGGNDILNGGRGGDDLTGGAGADTFRIWDLGTGTEADEIMDFATGVDTIDLSGFFSNARANHFASSAQPAPDFIGSSAFSDDGSAEVRAILQNGVTRIELDFGDGTPDLAVIVHGTVAAGDFLF